MKTVKVKLYRKPISLNRWSLYLDYYPPVPHPENGKLVRRECLNIYIYQPPCSEIYEKFNNEMLRKAETIRLQKIKALQNNESIFSGKENSNSDFSSLFYKEALKNEYRWMIAYKYFKNFLDGKTCLIEDIDEDLCEDFREYLLGANQLKYTHKKLSADTAHKYFTIFEKVADKYVL